jgi:hypothetical protein
MIAIPGKTRRTPKVEETESFLGLLPTVKRYAAVAFRRLSHEAREEAICEAVAHAFQAFCRLVELGKWDLAYALPMARFAVAHVRAGRRVGTKSNSRDVYARRAQVFGGFGLEHLQSTSTASGNWAEMLTDDTQTPIPDQVAFRLDFRIWLERQQQRDRRLVLFLALGNSPTDAARRFKVSTARISQLRAQLRSDWAAYQGEQLLDV